MLDPHNRVHLDSTRLLALGVINTSFEVSGSRLGDFPTLRAMILDHGCKYLFQLAQSDDSSIFQLTHRTISTMINAMRMHLKLQQELFHVYTLDRLAPPVTSKPSRRRMPVPQSGLLSHRPRTGYHSPDLDHVDETEVEKGSPTPDKPPVIPVRGEARDLLLETLSQISSHPGYLVELFSNYDCDINAENLFDKVLDILTKVDAKIQFDLFVAHNFPNSLGRTRRLLQGLITAVFIFKFPIPVSGRPSYLYKCDGYPSHCCEWLELSRKIYADQVVSQAQHGRRFVFASPVLAHVLLSSDPL
jgi:hypothetical protein